MSTEIVVAITSIIGIVVGAAANYLFTRGKLKAEKEKLEAEKKNLEAEAEKFKAEAEKARADAANARAELEKKVQISREAGGETIYYPNYGAMPSKFSTTETLKYITENKAELEILGRTCFRWLCGDETLFDSGNITDQEAFHQGQTALQAQIRKAVESGSKIHFVLQNPHLPVDVFDDRENSLLHKHAMAAIDSFEHIRAQLSGYDQERFKMSFLNGVVDNSMLRLQEQGRMTRFIFDLSIKFKSSPKEFKPLLAFLTEGIEGLGFVIAFEDILRSCDSIPKYREKKIEGNKKIDRLVYEYSYHSSQREDKTEKLATLIAGRFLGKPIPPASIQLLITHACTTECKMCNHYKLHAQLEKKKTSELDSRELFAILGYIKDIGTRSVVLSGGEPLARSDFFEIIEYGKELGLSIGLLTNGVKEGGQSLTGDEAKRITNAASWIQVSVDSFERDTYAKIRRRDYLDAVLESVKQLTKAAPAKIEMCYTIQKDNIAEVSNIPAKIAEYGLSPSVPVRLKFVHGPDAGRSFLCNSSELNSLLKRIPTSDQLNSSYLISMIDKGYFDLDGISQGKPLASRMQFYSMDDSRTCNCRILSLSCVIDPFGDVYPCCFLYDDNLADSLVRDRYWLGSIRPKFASDKNRARSASDENPLETIWYGGTIEIYRNHKLPVDKNVCCYCTRHFYQNEFLNKVYDVFGEYKFYGVAEEWADNKPEVLNEPLWL